MDSSSPPTLPAVPGQALLLRPVAAALARPELAESAAAFCSELGEILRCARGSVGVLEQGELRLAGSSHPAELRTGLAGATTLLDAMQEALGQQQAVTWPPAGPDLITLAQRQLAAAGTACSVPLVDGTGVVAPCATRCTCRTCAATPGGPAAGANGSACRRPARRRCWRPARPWLAAYAPPAAVYRVPLVLTSVF